MAYPTHQRVGMKGVPMKDFEKNAFLAQRLVSGLTGWAKLQVVCRLGQAVDENAARAIAAQIITSQAEPFIVRINAEPSNWKGQRKVDIGMGAAGSTKQTYWGAVELKWPSLKLSKQHDSVRKDCLQDIARLASIRTEERKCLLFVIGGFWPTIKNVLEIQEEDKAPSAGLLREMLSLDPEKTQKHIKVKTAESILPELQERIPDSAKMSPESVISTVFCGKERILDASRVFGEVHAWMVARIDEASLVSQGLRAEQ